MLAWVYDAANACPQLDDLIIATDSERGRRPLPSATAGPSDSPPPTSPAAPTASTPSPSSIHADIYVNIQGDEPLLKPRTPHRAPRPFPRSASRGHHPQSRSAPPKTSRNPNAVKVVTAAGRPRPLLLPRHHPLRPRHNPRHASTGSTSACTPTGTPPSTASLPSPRAPRADRTPRATPLPRKQHPHLRRDHTPRHHRRRHRSRPPDRRAPPQPARRNPAPTASHLADSAAQSAPPKPSPPSQSAASSPSPVSPRHGAAA